MAPGCNSDIRNAAKLIREKAEELGSSGMLGVNVSVQELAEALLEKQTLLHSEIQAICGRYRDVPAA